jgi:hypothetical protein
VQFVAQLGYDTSLGSRSCSSPNLAAEGVVVSYSTNGGMSWTLLGTINYDADRQPTYVNFDLPPAAQTSATRIQIAQLANTGSSLDVWVRVNLICPMCFCIIHLVFTLSAVMDLTCFPHAYHDPVTPSLFAHICHEFHQ